MSKCFVLGAGFSKAIANLPLMKELTAAFQSVRAREEVNGNTNRVFWADRINNYLYYLENEFFVKPCVTNTPGRTYRDCNFKENIEALLSFIDLNLSGQIRATVIDANGEKADFTKSSLFWNFTDLGDLRGAITTYIYLSLIHPEVQQNVMESFVRLLNDGDQIVTFNYDLMVETALYERNLWNPSDGYGVQFQSLPEISHSHRFNSKNQLFKLHGSLNWEGLSIFGPELEMEFFYDDGTPIFPDFLLKEKPRKFIPYQGAHGGCWIMPTFIKDFSVPELLRVWRSAHEALLKAQEVIVIGYSLPLADSAACVLFGTTDIAQKRVRIIDPDYSVKGRFCQITGNQNIQHYENIENFIEKVA